MQSEHFFSILTPTYKRPDLLQRAIASVVAQDHSRWEMIIVNDAPDSPLNPMYDERVHLITNNSNVGANQSRNRALSLVSPESTRVLFLDDDDYLASGALTRLTQLLEQHQNTPWLVTNRARADGTSLTHASESGKIYTYTWDYLIGRKITGDATHCIEASIARSITFPTQIKNGEEWLYFFELSRHAPFFYVDITSTLSDGYAENGLNFRTRTTLDQLSTLRILVQEGMNRTLGTSFAFWIYMAMRLVRACIKNR